MEMEGKLREQIQKLLDLHRDLDEKITKCIGGEFEKMSLKKQKLKIKDQISALQAMLHPDLVA
jgi:hypothetical protein